ncbi:MAG: DUF2161 family putative PD-(D/E)XK-type phosphodiesterase [Myxococcota bacterium]|nr:DUF2161 family putative PD-(D/E)XK-type phosphodiesterase [Myxococcota bacterium]
MIEITYGKLVMGEFEDRPKFTCIRFSAPHPIFERNVRRHLPTRDSGVHEMVMKESDLYLPLKRFLESQNYKVKGEIRDCDAVAVRGVENPIVVELKLSLNLDVILQAVDRLAMTPKVYIGIPKQCKNFRRRRKPIIKLLRMLGLGLVVIDSDLETGAVDVLIDPAEYRPRRSKHRRELLLGEFMQRVGDPNLGGAEKRQGIMTAYRQRALALARYLREQGPSKASQMASALGEPKSRDILYKNVYGWFNRVSLGVYELSPRGEREIPLWRKVKE